jgi:DNA-binding NtrC family response regulator
MVLYAKTPTLEDIIFEIRKYLIETKCNVTETAARMCWKRPDVWSIIEENAHAFGDLLETVRIDTNLMKRMEAASRKETIERALKIANGRVSIAAGILGIKRSTLQERIAELMISCHRESLDDASARSADNN